MVRTTTPVATRRSVGQPRSLRREALRKSIHLLIGLVPTLASINLPATLGLLAAGTVMYVLAEDQRRRGARVAVISDLTVIASRDREVGRFVLGPVTLGLGAMMSLMLYPEPASAIAIYALAFGDSAASLIGTAVGGPRLPFTGGKTVAGSFACFTAVALVAGGISQSAPAALMIALVATVLEAAPTRDFDNLVLPVGVGWLAVQLLT